MIDSRLYRFEGLTERPNFRWNTTTSWPRKEHRQARAAAVEEDESFPARKPLVAEEISEKPKMRGLWGKEEARPEREVRVETEDDIKVDGSGDDDDDESLLP